MTIKDQYRRERRRIQRTKRAYEKRGLDVNIQIPDIPKKITEGSVRRLKKISLGYIRERSQGADYETGEVLNYYRYQRQERKISRENKSVKNMLDAPQSWQLALDHLYSIIHEYEDKAEAIYNDRIQQYIKQYGEKELGLAVEKLINEDKLPEPKESYNIGYILMTLSYLDTLLTMDTKTRRKVLASIDEEAYYEEYSGEFDEW